MQRLYVITPLLFALCVSARAQFLASTLVSPATSSPEAPQWQKEEDRVFGHIAKNRLRQMKTMGAGIVSFFHDSVLTDVSTTWHGEYFAAGAGSPSLKFGVNCLFNDRNDLTVFANDISPLLGHFTVNGHVFATLKGYSDRPGCPFFEFDLPAQQEDGEGSVHVKAWLVTADSSNSLPYVPMTRREYLDEARQEVQQHKQAVIANTRGTIHIRTAGEQEAERQQTLEQLRNTYSGAELQTRIRIYQSNDKKDEDYMDQAIRVNTAALDRTLDRIDSLLRYCTAQQLSQPAVVLDPAVVSKPAITSQPADEFRGFANGQPGSSMLIRLCPSYYTGDVDPQRLQSLLVCWRYHPADAGAAGIDEELGGFDPARLRPVFRVPPE